MKKIRNIEWSNATAGQRLVQQKFPKNAGEEGISGDGQYAVLMCDYFHPGARNFYYGKIYLCDSPERAEEIATDMGKHYPGWAKHAYCHGCTKVGVRPRHRVVNLERT